MGKSNKKSATKVDSAPAVIKATEPLKKGKREPENDSETKVNVKKQKKDVVAAVKLPKKVESDSSDSAVSEEELEVVPATNGSDAESDDDVEDAMAEAETKESGSDESDEESGEEEESDEETEAPKKKEKTVSTPSTGGGNTLFAANLAYKIEKSDIENFFKGVGQVVDVRFSTNKEDGRFRGFGHVEFASAEDAQKARELNGKPLLGREIRLDAAAERGERPAFTPQSGGRGSGGGSGGQTIFVKGFDSSLDEADIKTALNKHFSSCGEITRVSVPMDRDTGSSKGIAYIDFKEGADKALELSGSDMLGCSLVVDEAHKPSGGGGGRGGGRGGGGGRFNNNGRGGGGGRGGRGGRGRGGGRGRW